jgi:diadenosine tetraphosphate (Ap4A) HIT family hydrolase
MKDCPFCNLENEGNVVLSNDYCLFLQQEQPVLVGSGIIVPRKHRENVFELTEEEWKATFDLLKEVKAFLDDKYSPQGYNVGWNVGNVGGQHIFHAHLHVIPRFEDEPYAGKGIRHWIKKPENKRT